MAACLRGVLLPTVSHRQDPFALWGRLHFRDFHQTMFWRHANSCTSVEINQAGALTHNGRPVRAREEFFDYLTFQHTKFGHLSAEKLYDLASRSFSYIPLQACIALVHTCPICNRMGAPERSIAPPQLILDQGLAPTPLLCFLQLQAQDGNSAAALMAHMKNLGKSLIDVRASPCGVKIMILPVISSTATDYHTHQL